MIKLGTPDIKTSNNSEMLEDKIYDFLQNPDNRRILGDELTNMYEESVDNAQNKAELNTVFTKIKNAVEFRGKPFSGMSSREEFYNSGLNKISQEENKKKIRRKLAK